MSLGMVLLGVLADGPAHGYDLKRVHDERFPAVRSLAYGQVYATLTRLQRDGLVETLAVEQENGPERTTYAVTAAGRAELDDWLGTPEQPGPYAADELVRKTVVSLLRGRRPDDFLARQRAVHLQAMRDLTRRRQASADLGDRIALDHLIVHLDADLTWLEETRQRVEAASGLSPSAAAPDPAPRSATDPAEHEEHRR